MNCLRNNTDNASVTELVTEKADKPLKRSDLDRRLLASSAPHAAETGVAYCQTQGPFAHPGRPTGLRFQQFYKLPKTTGQIFQENFTTLVLTTKDGVALPCYYKAVKEQVFSSLLLLVKHSTEQILLENANSVKMLSQEFAFGSVARNE
ncbi:hypothetical protein J6590_049873 [Homalodisca vitripennis]|nr:hypothetical protein J6590_049873 [Homalodisca vitripennis]